MSKSGEWILNYTLGLHLKSVRIQGIKKSWKGESFPGSSIEILAQILALSYRYSFLCTKPCSQA